MDIPNQGIRYLLWRDNPSADRARWPDRLGSLAQCSPARAAELLAGAPPYPREVRCIAESLRVTEEDVLFGAPQRSEILPGNLGYLFRLAGHGSQKEFAARFRVSAVSVSRWCNGTQIPRPNNMDQLFRFFGIEASDDLRGVPFFLVDAPISDHTRRAWLHRWVDRCPPATLSVLFPALRKLLHNDDDH